MRRFSQRNSLVTLSDINLTTLLDLAFVLLIIFVITTPLLQKGLDLQLPSNGGHEDKKDINTKNIHRIEVSPQGYYLLDKRRMTLQQISGALETEFRGNRNLILDILADENGKYKLVADILAECEKIGIVNISLRTETRPTP
jgi:biopolymer transport protein ExbD